MGSEGSPFKHWCRNRLGQCLITLKGRQQKTESNMNKALILQTAQAVFSDKISKLETLIHQTREANNETKSSMGDKYETSREMVQQEINNLLSQLAVAKEQRSLLSALQLRASSKVEVGAVVQTQAGMFFIAVATGIFIVEGKKIFGISVESPLAVAMAGKSVGEKFSVNHNEQIIKNIW